MLKLSEKLDHKCLVLVRSDNSMKMYHLCVYADLQKCNRDSQMKGMKIH